LANTYPRSAIPEPYQTIVRRELRKIPTWKLQEAYGKLKAGESTGIELVERDRAYAISAIAEVLWERGKELGGNPTTSPRADKEEAELLKGILPVVGIGTVIVVAIGLLGRVVTERRVYAQDGQYLVSVRYPGQLHELREFIQPDNPDVVAVYSRIGPDAWNLYNFVCQNISYRRDVGEFWLFPSETLGGYGDCEDTSILLASLLRNFTDAHVALGGFQGYGHAWCDLNGQILETTYTSARPVPDPQDYCPYVYFNDMELTELWPGALGEVFELGRDEAAKLNLIVKALEAVAC